MINRLNSNNFFMKPKTTKTAEIKCTCDLSYKIRNV